MNTGKRNYIIHPLPGYEPEIGRWLWALEDTRGRTIRTVEKLPQSALDAAPPVGGNTIGALLYHIALAEASWLYEDVLQQELPPDVAELFPYDSRDERGLLSRLEGHSMHTYLHRLAVVRAKLLEAYRSMSLTEFWRVRSIEQYYDVTPEWALYHLLEHEVEHRGQIEIIIEHLGLNEPPKPPAAG